MKTTIQYKLLMLASLVCLAITTGFSQQTAQNISCLKTDLNQDAVIDINDFMIFAPAFGTTCSAGSCPTDFNNDGVTDVNDFVIFAPAFGSRCEAFIFDVTNAVYSPGYVDVPLSISLTQVDNNGIDIEQYYNKNKLTPSSLINIINNLSISTNFSFIPSNGAFILSGALSGNLNFQNNAAINLLSIRFAINAGQTINKSDFYSTNRSSVGIIQARTIGVIVK